MDDFAAARTFVYMARCGLGLGFFLGLFFGVFGGAAFGLWNEWTATPEEYEEMGLGFAESTAMGMMFFGSFVGPILGALAGSVIGPLAGLVGKWMTASRRRNERAKSSPGAGVP
jgi:hypothetical protein